MQDLIESYRVERGRLKQRERELLSERDIVDSNHPEGMDLSLISSMIRGIDFTLCLMQRYIENREETTVTSYHKRQSWDPRWMDSLSQGNRFEDDVLDRLCPEDRPSPVKIDLSVLPRRQGEAIQMYADGLSYLAIGEVMGVEKGSVSKHVKLARNKFKYGVPLALDLEMT